MVRFGKTHEKKDCFVCIGETEKMEYQTIWSNCPHDVLIMIFQTLDAQALLRCMEVNLWWRDIVIYYIQVYDRWSEIAKKGIACTASFRTKSCPALSWRDLYVNSLLWDQLEAAEITWEHLDRIAGAMYMHTYKDVLVVVREKNQEMKYYNIPASEYIQDLPSNLSNLADNTTDPPSEDYSLLATAIQEDYIKKLIVLDDNCFYLMNKNNALRHFQREDHSDQWRDRLLARYYGPDTSMADVYVYKEEIYMLMKNGAVLQVDEEGRHFRNHFFIRRVDEKLYQNSMFMYAQMLQSESPRGTSADTQASDGHKVLSDQVDAILAVPGNRPFEIKVNRETGGSVLVCPGLTCVTPHGHIMFLGFKDGKVVITFIKKLFINGGKPERIVNVQDYTKVKVENPAVTAIEVYEAKGSHHLFIATRSNIYKLVLTYPKDVFTMLGF